MWNRAFVLSKLKALAIHLSLSGVAFAVVLYFILVRWYPQPWFIDGGWQGVRIMVAVDLVLGPALTFIIFNASKSRRALLFDFSMIGLTQAGAFIWGVYAVHAQRPVGVSFYDGSFYSFEEKQLKKQGHTAAELARIDDRVPAMLFTGPQTKEEIAEMIGLVWSEGLPEYEQFQVLRPIRPHLDEVFEHSTAIGDVLWGDPHEKERLERILREHPQVKPADLRFVQFSGRYQDATLVMNAEGDVLGHARYVNPKRPAKSEPRPPAGDTSAKRASAT